MVLNVRFRMWFVKSHDPAGGGPGCESRFMTRKNTSRTLKQTPQIGNHF